MSINSGERGVTTGVRQNNVWAEAAAIDKEQIDFPYPDSLLTQGQMTGVSGSLMKEAPQNLCNGRLSSIFI